MLARDFTWNLKDEQRSKLSTYRVQDNYLRFYLKYIEPQKHKIERGLVKSLPAAWLSIMGLQFENLVLNNLPILIDKLHIPPHEVVAIGAYLQTEAQGRKKCQIDALIQVKYNQLYLCEVKFSRSEIGVEVVAEVQEKLKRLKRPKGFSCRPVLLHINGVAPSVIESEYFSRIIDFSELLSG